MPTDKEVGIRRIPAYTLHYSVVTTPLHGSPNHHWLWKLHTGLQATWNLCLSTLPPDSGTLFRGYPLAQYENIEVWYLFLSTWQPCARALSPLDKHACFLKTPASLQFSDLHLIFYYQKSEIHQVFTYEREREKEREMLCVYVWMTSATVKLWL